MVIDYFTRGTITTIPRSVPTVDKDIECMENKTPGQLQNILFVKNFSVENFDFV